ncbi:glycosyltransferase family 4 protein [Clostridium sp. C8-1-8]|uniref:glycosyltransferase family 4 protein n=1 Tax=Clostridium sp. C8-1-8 TaxID=2698831 RepID=UPI00136EB774|nr:glycosyltransferase family 4 protein [Clostridium sp. C8-1-8]
MDRKLKLLYISEATSGGVRKNVLDLINNIDKDKFEVHFIYSDIRADDIFIDNIKVLSKNISTYNVKMVRNLNFFEDIKSFLKINNIVRKVKPDIVHCHSSKAGGIGRLIAYINRVPKIIYTPHAYVIQNPNIGNLKRNIFYIIEKLLARLTTTTINVSNGEKQFAVQSKLIEKQKSKVIYNGIENIISDIGNIHSKRNELGLSREDFIVGVASRLEVQKDPFTFIKIAIKVCNHMPNVKFIYVGDGELSLDIRKILKQNNMEDRIKLLGFRDDISEIISVFDIYMITSLYEGLPYSLVEAIACGKPILATNVIGNNEIVIEGVNGELFEKGNIEQGFHKLVGMITDQEKLTRYSEESLKMYSSKFTIDNMIQNVELVYYNKTS